MSLLKLKLVTGRSLKQGEFLGDKFSKEYIDNVAVIELDEKDLKRLGIKEGSRVKVRSPFGEVVVKALKSRFFTEGVAFMPMGPWASAIVDPDTRGSGMPTLKGLEVEISPTSEEITPLRELLGKVSERAPLKEEFPSEVPQNPGSGRTVKDVVCNFCGCLCDDLEVIIANGKIVDVKRACVLGRSKIMGYSKNRILAPYVRRGGSLVKVDLKEAVKRAAEILVSAKYPLLYGWSSTSTEAIRLGIELAELLGGVFDNTSVICHGPTIQALQEVGIVTSTLGQVKNYADLVIYWGCNPLNAHPRHLTRYSALARGIYVKSRKDRRIVVVDVRYTDTARVADLFIKVKPGHDYELISALRMAVKEYDFEAKEVAGVPQETIYQLADMMTSCRFGVLFYGLGVTMTAGKSRNIEELIKLVQDLNEWTKFVLIPMRGHYNVTGANQACAWTTGYAFAIDFRRGYPRHNPGLTSATDLLLNGDVDAVLVVASDPVAHFPKKAVGHLLEVPVITIDPKWSLTATVSDVVIPSAIVGVECEGTAYRMDGVPLRLKSLIKPPRGVLSDEEVLNLIISKVRRLKKY